MIIYTTKEPWYSTVDRDTIALNNINTKLPACGEFKEPVIPTLEKLVDGRYFTLEGTPGISKFNYLLTTKKVSLLGCNKTLLRFLINSKELMTAI